MANLLAKIFGVDPESPSAKLAADQVRSDSDFLEQMILCRRTKHQKLDDFAEVCGVSAERLEDFEADPLDFDLMLIRQYAHALDLYIEHRVYSAEHRDREQKDDAVTMQLVHSLLRENTWQHDQHSRKRVPQYEAANVGSAV